MGALFDLTLGVKCQDVVYTKMVKGDEQVMARAPERDCSHILITGKQTGSNGSPSNDNPPEPTCNFFGIRSTGKNSDAIVHSRVRPVLNRATHGIGRLNDEAAPSHLARRSRP